MKLYTNRIGINAIHIAKIIGMVKINVVNITGASMKSSKIHIFTL
jgi:hypothetical protein